MPIRSGPVAIISSLGVAGWMLAACLPAPSKPQPTLPASPLPSVAVQVPTEPPASTGLPATVTPLPPTAPPITTPAQAAVRDLASRLRVDPASVSIVKQMRVLWPDSCLGIYLPDHACAQAIEPGFALRLQAGQEIYDYHIDLSGAHLESVPSPAAPQGGLFVSWQDVGNCQQASIDSQGVQAGKCGETPAGFPFGAPDRVGQLQHLISSYAPVYDQSAAGVVSLGSEDGLVPSAPERRMLFEWASQVAQEASGGRSCAACGLAFGWHRQGGIAGFCDDLAVYRTGVVMPSSCRPGSNPIPEAWLTSGELGQLYTWIDDYKPFEWMEADQATADSMQVHLVFYGSGQNDASAAEQQAIAEFASALQARLTAP
jgi:hypothetical protein